MNNIDKLIKELCPNGVEWKELQSVVKSIKTGLNPRKNFKLNAQNATNFYVTVKEITTGKILFSDKTDKINNEAIDVISNRSNLEMNDVLFSGIGTIGKVAIVDIPVDNWNVSESVFLLKPIQSVIVPKFLMYILTSNDIKTQYEGQSVGSTLRGVRMGVLSKLLIPIPPLPIQQEIVNILDKFTALEAELQAELDARRKQYEYYREKLLTFSEIETSRGGVSSLLSASYVEWRTLGEILYRTKGTKITAGRMNELHSDNGKIKIFAGGKTFAMVNYSDIPEKDICKLPSVIVKSRGIIEFEYFERPFSHKNEFWSYQSKSSNLSIKYVYYFLKTKESHFQNIASRMQMPQISIPDTDKFQIPIPPLSEQKRIVGILDKFEELVNKSLPEEIEARRKQYEYYREKLLTF